MTYDTFKYRVRWDGRYVAGASRVTGLVQARRPVGAFGDTSIALERGVTYDLEFDRWARDGKDDDARVLEIELHDPAIAHAIVYRLAASWTSEYKRLLPDGTDAIQFQELRLQHAGWERVEEPE
jgi:hypothetical protein